MAFSCSMVTSSQTYTFEYLIKSAMINHKNGYENTNDLFVNAKDTSYYGSFSPTTDSKGYNLIIYDYKNHLSHTFRIEKKEAPNNGSKYAYIGSGYILPHKKIEKTQQEMAFTHTFIEDIPDGKRMLLRKFKNAKAKKADVEMVGDFIELDTDLRPFSYQKLFGSRADLVHIADQEKYYLKDAHWNVEDSKGEYHTEIYQIPLSLTLDPRKIKLPKEKPKSPEELLEDLKKTIKR